MVLNIMKQGPIPSIDIQYEASLRHVYDFKALASNPVSRYEYNVLHADDEFHLFINLFFQSTTL